MLQRVPTMIGQSVDVLSNPNEQTFERYERHGTLQDAAIYVGLAALLTALIGIPGGLGGIIGNLLGALLGFVLFTGLIYWVGKQQGGTGTLDEVAYTFALFIAPLTLVNGIVRLTASLPVIGLLTPLLGLALLAVQAVFAYLAVRSSMNLNDKTRALLTLGGAVLATWILEMILLLVTGAVFN